MADLLFFCTDFFSKGEVFSHRLLARTHKRAKELSPAIGGWKITQPPSLASLLGIPKHTHTHTIPPSPLYARYASIYIPPPPPLGVLARRSSPPQQNRSDQLLPIFDRISAIRYF